MSKFGKRALALMMAFVMVLSNVSGVAQAAFAAELEETVPVTVETEPASIVETTEIAVETTAAPAVEPTQEPVVETTENASIETTVESETVPEETSTEETGVEEETFPAETEEEFISDEIVDEEASAVALEIGVSGLIASHSELEITSSVSNRVDPILTASAEGTSINMLISSKGRTQTSRTVLTLTNTLEEEARLSFDWETIKIRSGSKITLSYDATVTAASGEDSFEVKSTTTQGIMEFVMPAGTSIYFTMESGAATSASHMVGLNLVLRNLNLYLDADIETTFKSVDPVLGSYTVDGNAITVDTVINKKAQQGYSLAAIAAEGYVFSGWYSETKAAFISYKVEVALQITEQMAVYPVFISAEDALWAVGEANFADVEDAFLCAESSIVKEVALLKDYTLSEDLTIPAGVTVLIPFNKENTCYTIKPETTPGQDPENDGTLNAPSPWEIPYPYRTLFIGEGVTLTVNGGLSVSAQHSPGSQLTAGSPSGPCGFIKTANNAKIDVKSGGGLYAWGYIVGSGTIAVNPGAEVYENLQVTDFRGGSASGNIAANKAIGVFPFSQYYVQNVEVPMTIHSGAKEVVYISIWAANSISSLPVEFIGTQDAMFRMGTGAYIVKSYDATNDRLVVETYGDVSLYAMSITHPMVGTIASSDFNLPITNNITINVNSGKTTINQSVALLPGVVVSVDEGASLEIAESYYALDEKGNVIDGDERTGWNVYVYDAAEWLEKNFVYLNTKMSPVAWSSVNGTAKIRNNEDLADAKIDINGVAYVRGYLYTTASGANICSTEGTGKIILWNGNGEKTATYQVTQLDVNVTYEPIVITAAQLKNGDGTYTDTSAAEPDVGEAYYYNATTGKWDTASYLTFVTHWGEPIEPEEHLNIDIETTLAEGGEYLVALPGYEDALFLGWDIDSDGEVDYVEGDEIAMTGNLTLHAVWKPFTLTWVDAEGTTTWDNVEAGTSFDTVKAADGKPGNETSHFIFSHWEDENGQKLEVPFVVTGDATYTAVYAEVAHVFGTEVEGTKVPATCTAGGSVTLQCDCGATKQIVLSVDPNAHTEQLVTEYTNTKTHKVYWPCCETVVKELENHTLDCVCGAIAIVYENKGVEVNETLSIEQTDYIFAQPGMDLVLTVKETAGTGALFQLNADRLYNYFTAETVTVPAAEIAGGAETIFGITTYMAKIDVNGGNLDANTQILDLAWNGVTVDENGNVFWPLPLDPGDAESTAQIMLNVFWMDENHTVAGLTDAEGNFCETDAEKTAAIFRNLTRDIELTVAWACKSEQLIHVEAKAANCTDTGNHEHWKCGCGKLYLDAEGTQETTLEDVTIPTNGEHDWALTGYEVSEESHISVFVCNHDERHTKRSAAEEHDFNNEEHKCVCGKLNKFTITFMDAENQQITTITAEYGSDISAAVSEIEENFAKENLGLLITRWEDEKGQEVSLDTMPGGDVTVHAVCVYQTFEITWVVEGEVWDTDIVYFMQEIEAPVPTKEAEGCTAYAFVGWDPEVPEHMPSRDVTFNAVFEPYTKHVSEEITYKNVTDTTHDEYHACCDTLIRAGAAHDYNNAAHRCGCGVYEQITVNVYWSEEITWSFERDYGTTTTIPVGPAHPGYNFIGFAKSEGGEVFLPCGENGGNPVYTYTESVDLYPVFTMNTFTYTVETWEMDTNGQYVKTKTEEKTADYGTVIDLTGTETPDYLYVNGEYADSKLTATVPANNDLVMKVYLARKVLTVKVVWVEKIAWELTPYYGSTSSIPTGTTPEGHTFLGFAKTAGGEVFLPANAEGDYTKTWTESMELHAVFAVNSYTYTVETWEMDTAGQYVKVKTEEKTADYGTVIDLTKTQTPEYLYVNGEHVDSKLTATVPANNDLVMKVYLARKALTVKVIWDEKTSWELKPYYGATSDIPTGTTPEGHTFLGFAKTAGGEVFLPAQAEGTYTYTWTESMDLYAVFAVNTYTVTFTMNGEAFGEPVSVKYGESVTAPSYTVPAGHTFSGWTLPETMPAEDITLDATLTINSYTLVIEAMEFSGDEDPANNVLEVEVPYGAKLADYITSEIEGCVIYTTGDEIDVDGKMYKGTYFVYGWESWDEENGYQTIDLETITMPIGGITITQAFSYTGWNFAEEGTKYILDGFETSNTVAHIGEEAYLFGEEGYIIAGAGLYRHVAEDGTVEYYYFCDGVDCVNGCTEASYTAFRNTATSETDTDAAIHWVSKHNDLLPAWDYAFDARGVILHHEDTSLKGLHDEGEDTIYYIDGVPAYMGLIQEGESYYYVRSSGKIVKNASYWITKTNGLLEEGAYLFDENGVLIPEQLIVKDGIVEENGGLYYYVDGVLTYAGLIQLNGEYYYVRSNGQLVQNQKYWVTKTNNLLPEDSYTFDAEGKIVFTLEQEQFTGIADGYYYVDGVKTYAGLIQIDGAYYYVNSSCQVITGRNYWITKTNGLMPEGIYTFGEEGKMVQTEQDTGLNGIVDGYYYVDGVKTYAGLIEIDGKYYYANSTGKIIMGRKYWITKTNGLMAEGAYEFDATGAMIMN